MLFSFSEYLLGSLVVHSSLWTPLALPVLLQTAWIFLPVSLSQFGSGTALDFYNWRTELLHFPLISGDKTH